VAVDEIAVRKFSLGGIAGTTLQCTNHTIQIASEAISTKSQANAQSD